MFNRIFRSKAPKIDGERFKSHGHTFTYVEPLKLPMARIKRYARSLQELDWGCTKEDLDAFIEIVEEETLNNNRGQVITLLNYFKDYRAEYASAKVLLKLANNFILLDDEDPNEVDPEIYERKLALVEKYNDLETFFLTKALYSIDNTQKESNISKLKDYLMGEVHKLKEKTFLQNLGTTRYTSDTGKTESQGHKQGGTTKNTT